MKVTNYKSSLCSAMPVFGYFSSYPSVVGVRGVSVSFISISTVPHSYLGFPAVRCSSLTQIGIIMLPEQQ